MKINREETITFDAESLNEKWGQMVTCPNCQEHDLYFDEPEYSLSNDTWGVAWEGRGNAIRIRFFCEMCHHHWTLRFGWHKGQTYLKIENIKELEQPTEDDKKEVEAIAFYHAGYEAGRSGKEFNHHKAIEMARNLKDLNKGEYSF